MSNEQAAQTPLEDLRKSAMEQYEKLSDEAHHWNSFIIHAIEKYIPPGYPDPFLQYLDEEIKACNYNIEVFMKKNIDTLYWEGRLTSYEEVKDKYLSLINAGK